MAYKDPKFSLYRSKDGAILGGVCSGLSESLKIDVTIIRILFLIPLLVFGTGGEGHADIKLDFNNQDSFYFG